MSRPDHWLNVSHRAQHDSATEEVEEILIANGDIGLPAATAWMSRAEADPTMRSEITLSVEDIACGFGFNLDVDHLEMEASDVAVWSPVDEIDRRTILRDLDLAPSEKRRIESALMETLGDSGVVIYAVRNIESRKTEGFIAYDRNLTFFSDCVNLEYEVWAFHCKDDVVLRGALYAAFHNQAVMDLQGALDSMARAGVSPRLGFHLNASGDDLQDNLEELVDLARENLFSVDQMPHVDIEAYGSWLSGSKASDENRVLVRAPAFRPTSQ
jgi:hypothetical protein